MAHCRIVYALTLGGVFLFYLCFTGYLSFYLLLLTVLFPLLSLAVSLPGMLGSKTRLDMPPSDLRRGETARFTLVVTAPVPMARITARLRLRNRLNGWTITTRLRRIAPGKEALLHQDVPCPHCGLISCEVLSLRVCDLLGLFSLRRPIPPAVQSLVWPEELPAETVSALSGAQRGGEVLLPRPGGGPGEDYDLRPYRPGDPPRSIHWKLTAKLGEPVVRETLEARRQILLITLEHTGGDQLLDRLLARLSAVSAALQALELEHFIRWVEPVSGKVQTCRVSTPQDFRRCLFVYCATPAALSGLSVLELPLRVEGQSGQLRHFHLLPPDAEGGTT